MCMEKARSLLLPLLLACRTKTPLRTRFLSSPLSSLHIAHSFAQLIWNDNETRHYLQVDSRLPQEFQEGLNFEIVMQRFRLV